jgi:hypothetical protein
MIYGNSGCVMELMWTGGQAERSFEVSDGRWWHNDEPR